jgi:hypothetical protein
MMYRWREPLPPERRRQKFSPDEDARLRELVGLFGSNNWERVASQLPGRNVRQCRERWKHYVSTSKPGCEWSPDEDRLLCDKMQELGPRWTTIARAFPGRSDVQIKSRWMQTVAASSDLHVRKPPKATAGEVPTFPEFQGQPPVIAYPPPPFGWPRPAEIACSVIYVVHWMMPQPM